MSNSGGGRTGIDDALKYESISNRFNESMNFDTNKPDFKELDLNSPSSNVMYKSRKSNSASVAVAATSSSSSSSSGSVTGKPNNHVSTSNNSQSSVKQPKSHSGELLSSPETAESARSGTTPRGLKPGHRRSVSAGPPLIYSGNFNGGSVNSVHTATSHPNPTVLPTGNICPSGKILKSSLAASRNTTRTDVLRSGTVNYGHGSIMRSNAKLSNAGSNPDLNSASNGQFTGVTTDPEELKKAGNEMYKKGNFMEALSLYDRAISISPANAAYRSNRAAALTGLGRLGEAVKECVEAARLDPGYWRAHQRLASLYIRLGQVENARHHLNIPGQQPDQTELQKLHSLEKYLSRCADARKVGDWKSALRECNAAISAGADYSPQLIACRAEALLKLHQLEDANCSLSNMPKIEPHTTSISQTKFFGMFAEAYLLYVRAHMEMALGRLENAVSMAEKAAVIDYSNIEVSKLLNNVKIVARARARGNDLFSGGRFSEASSAYEEGLKYDPFNSVLLCNRAVCWSKMGVWEQSVEDCNQALKIQPNYTKALLRRAASNGKLGRWAEAVRDYEVLRKQLPGDNDVVESLFHAQNALKKSREDEVNVRKFNEVEVVTNLEQFKTAISSSCVSVIYYRMASNLQCEQISPFINTLCLRYPSIRFLKVDIEEIPIIAKSESIRAVPTFKIYKNGSAVKEMICPSHQVLEYSVKQYNL